MNIDITAIIIAIVAGGSINLIIRWLDKRKVAVEIVKTGTESDKISMETAEVATTVLQDVIKELRGHIEFLKVFDKETREVIMKDQKMIIDNQKELLAKQEYIEADTKSSVERLNVLVSENISLRGEIVSLKSEIVSLKNEIFRLNNIEIVNLKAEVVRLHLLVEGLEKQIAALQLDKRDLKVDKAEMRQDKIDLKTVPDISGTYEVEVNKGG
jgi:chromosome segregation ATPase